MSLCLAEESDVMTSVSKVVKAKLIVKHLVFILRIRSKPPISHPSNAITISIGHSLVSSSSELE